MVDGDAIKLKDTIQNTGKMSTALAVDSKAKRLYTANADGEFITIDTTTNKILSRKKLLDDGKEHFFINLSLDTAGNRAFVMATSWQKSPRRNPWPCCLTRRVTRPT